MGALIKYGVVIILLLTSCIEFWQKYGPNKNNLVDHNKLKSIKFSKEFNFNNQREITINIDLDTPTHLSFYEVDAEKRSSSLISELAGSKRIAINL